MTSLRQSSRQAEALGVRMSLRQGAWTVRLSSAVGPVSGSTVPRRGATNCPFSTLVHAECFKEGILSTRTGESGDESIPAQLRAPVCGGPQWQVAGSVSLRGSGSLQPHSPSVAAPYTCPFLPPSQAFLVCSTGHAYCICQTLFINVISLYNYNFFVFIRKKLPPNFLVYLGIPLCSLGSGPNHREAALCTSTSCWQPFVRLWIHRGSWLLLDHWVVVCFVSLTVRHGLMEHSCPGWTPWWLNNYLVVARATTEFN